MEDPNIPNWPDGSTPRQRAYEYKLADERERAGRSGFGNKKAPMGIATGLLIWGFIVMAGDSPFAFYLIGAAVLIYVVSALVWIIRHPVRAFIGFLLIGSLIVFAFLKSVKIVREPPPQSSSEVNTPAKAKSQARTKTQ